MSMLSLVLRDTELSSPGWFLHTTTTDKRGFCLKEENQSFTLHKESDFADFYVKQKWERGEGGIRTIKVESVQVNK
jgi:hypothetical protein